jgi:hypothetical protein
MGGDLIWNYVIKMILKNVLMIVTDAINPIFRLTVVFMTMLIVIMIAKDVRKDVRKEL